MTKNKKKICIKTRPDIKSEPLLYFMVYIRKLLVNIICREERIYDHLILKNDDFKTNI